MNLPNRVTVIAPARLHLGFIDLNPPTGRRFGSLGLALDAPHTVVHAVRGATEVAHSKMQEKAQRYLHALCTAIAAPDDVAVRVDEAIPEHCGLGSGTQLALAVGTAVSRLLDLNLSPFDIRQKLARGARSGVGIGAFAHGGFLVDGGHGAGTSLPPITSRVAFPEHWRVVLIFDEAAQGLSGAKEVAAFRTLPTFPETLSAHLCRLVMTRVLPGLAEASMAEFGPAITEVQRIVGDHFAPAQGGRFASGRVAEVLAWLEGRGVHCVGQSSWGPTGFAMVESESQAVEFVREAEVKWREPSLRFVIARGRNTSASIKVHYIDNDRGTIIPFLPLQGARGDFG
jgi:beta-ribofuranosylaminobenzene 5'-phosphate synthase